jgi:hypothetical protein
MGSTTYRSELARLQTDLAKLQKDIAAQISISSKARSESSKKAALAARSSSASSRSSYTKAAEGERNKAAVAERKIADLQGKVAAVVSKQQKAEARLTSALKSERGEAERKEKQAKREEKAERDKLARGDDARKRKEKSEADARSRDDARRRQTEKSHAREIGRLSMFTVRHIIERQPEPEKLRVLYLTSSPNLDDPLRVDAEVNNVLKRMRSVKHRDLIELHHRPAATPEDLLNGLNDLRPHVIHFSGHGNGDGLLFDDALIETPIGQMMDFTRLRRILEATNFPPTLLVLNACRSLEGAAVLLEAVPVLIAMPDSVADLSASLFAGHFYSAIGGAQSVGHAVAQAREMIEQALPGEPDLIEIRAAKGIDVDTLILVSELR